MTQAERTRNIEYVLAESTQQMAAPQTKEHGEDKHTGMQEIIRKRRRKKSRKRIILCLKPEPVLQLLQKDKFYKKNRGGNRIGLQYGIYPLGSQDWANINRRKIHYTINMLLLIPGTSTRYRRILPNPKTCLVLQSSAPITSIIIKFQVFCSQNGKCGGNRKQHHLHTLDTF